MRWRITVSPDERTPPEQQRWWLRQDGCDTQLKALILLSMREWISVAGPKFTDTSGIAQYLDLESWCVSVRAVNVWKLRKRDLYMPASAKTIHVVESCKCFMAGSTKPRSPCQFRVHSFLRMILRLVIIICRRCMGCPPLPSESRESGRTRLGGERPEPSYSDSWRLLVSPRGCHQDADPDRYVQLFPNTTTTPHPSTLLS